MDNFAKIGISVINRMVGIRDNYIIQKVNYPNSCANCSNRNILFEHQEYGRYTDTEYDAAQKACEQCPLHTQYLQAHIKDVKNKIYVNESNRYGSALRLSKGAILLYLGLHFFTHDDYGRINGITIKDIISFTGLSRSAVEKNMNVLIKNNLISVKKVSELWYDQDRAGSYHLMIHGYHDYFNDAVHGGRGFLVLSSDIYSEFKKISNVNALRIILKSLTELEQDPEKREDINAFLMKSYRDLMSYLPKYCRPGIIRTTLENVTAKILKMQIGKRSVSFKPFNNTNSKIVKQQAIDEFCLKFETFLRNSSASIQSLDRGLNVSTEHQWIVKLYNDYKKKNSALPKIRFVNDVSVIKNIAALAVQYDFCTVKQALIESIFYDNNVERIKNIGGFLRKRIRRIREIPNYIETMATAYTF